MKATGIVGSSAMDDLNKILNVECIKIFENSVFFKEAMEA